MFYYWSFLKAACAWSIIISQVFIGSMLNVHCYEDLTTLAFWSLEPILDTVDWFDCIICQYSFLQEVPLGSHLMWGQTVPLGSYLVWVQSLKPSLCLLDALSFTSNNKFACFFKEKMSGYCGHPVVPVCAQTHLPSISDEYRNPRLELLVISFFRASCQNVFLLKNFKGVRSLLQGRMQVEVEWKKMMTEYLVSSNYFPLSVKEYHCLQCSC